MYQLPPKQQSLNGRDLKQPDGSVSSYMVAPVSPGSKVTLALSAGWHQGQPRGDLVREETAQGHE